MTSLIDASYIESALTDIERSFDFLEKSGDPMGPTEAVVVADRAISKLLKAKLAQFETKSLVAEKRYGSDFPNIIRSLEDSGITVPMKEELYVIHRTRNKCVHTAETVERKQGKILVSATHQFAIKFSDYLGFDEHQVRLLEVVAKPHIRSSPSKLSGPHLSLTTALTASKNGDTHHAVRDAIASIEMLLADFAYESTGLEGVDKLLRLQEVQALFSRSLIQQMKGIYPIAREVVVHYLYPDTETADRTVRIAKLALEQASGQWLSTRQCFICGNHHVVGYRLQEDIGGASYRSPLANAKAYYCARHRSFSD